MNITSTTWRKASKFQQKLGAGLRRCWSRDVTSSHRARGSGATASLLPGRAQPTAKVPLLISRAGQPPYMVDLQADKSIVKGLERGETCTSSTGATRIVLIASSRSRITSSVSSAARWTCATHGGCGEPAGICQAARSCYSALNLDKVRNLVDGHAGRFPRRQHAVNWTRGMDVDLFVDTLGNVPADMNLCYLTLKPWRLFVQVRRPGGILDDTGRWRTSCAWRIFDSPDQAGEAFRQFIKQFYQGNGFINGIPSAARRPRLRRHAEPLNIFPNRTGLPDASRALGMVNAIRTVVPRRAHRHLHVQPRAENAGAIQLAGEAQQRLTDVRTAAFCCLLWRSAQPAGAASPEDEIAH